MDYYEARRKYSRCRNPSRGAVLTKNKTTKPSRAIDGYSVYLHGNEVVRYHKDGAESVSLAYWDTVTTKRCIHNYSRFYISSPQDGATVVWLNYKRWLGHSSTWFYEKDGKLVFSDGSTVPELVHTYLGRTSPLKSRQVLEHPRQGDILRAKACNYVYLSSYSLTAGWREYLGDHPLDRHYVVVKDADAILAESDMLNMIRMVRGWCNGARFLYEGRLE